MVFQIPHLDTISMPIVYSDNSNEDDKSNSNEDDNNLTDIFLINTQPILPSLTIPSIRKEEQVFQIEYKNSTNIPIQIFSPPFISYIGENPLDALTTNIPSKILPIMKNDSVIETTPSTYEILPNRSFSKPEISLVFPVMERLNAEVTETLSDVFLTPISYRISPILSDVSFHITSSTFNTLPNRSFSKPEITLSFVSSESHIPENNSQDILFSRPITKTEIPIEFLEKDKPTERKEIVDVFTLHNISNDFSVDSLSLKKPPISSSPIIVEKRTSLNVFVQTVSHKMSLVQEPSLKTEQEMNENHSFLC
jgi:hypothetical protein